MPRGHRADRRSTAGMRGVRRRSWLLLHPPERHGARPLRRFLAARGPQGDLLGRFTRATPSSSGCRTWEDRVQPAPEGSSWRKAPVLPKPNILLRLRNTVPRHAKPEMGTREGLQEAHPSVSSRELNPFRLVWRRRGAGTTPARLTFLPAFLPLLALPFPFLQRGKLATTRPSFTLAPAATFHLQAKTLAGGVLQQTAAQLQHLGVRVSGSGKGEGGSFWTESHVIGERNKGGSTSYPKQSPSPRRSFLQYQKTDPSLIPLARGKGWMWSPPPQLPCFSITYPDVFLALIPTGMSLCHRALCLRASA